MSNFLCPLLIVLILFNSCQGQEVKVSAAKRDTTITPLTSFSKLFFDSLKLEVFIKEQDADDSAASHLRNFYNRRNFQFAWFTEDGLAEHTRSFWNLHNNYILYFQDTALKYEKLHRLIDLLINDDTTLNITMERMLQTELQLSMHFFEYSDNAYTGKVDPNELQWHIPRKKINAVELLDSLIARDGKNLQDWEPVNIFHKRLKKELVRYYEINKAGGWKEIALDGLKRYKP